MNALQTRTGTLPSSLATFALTNACACLKFSSCSRESGELKHSDHRDCHQANAEDLPQHAGIDQARQQGPGQRAARRDDRQIAWDNQMYRSGGADGRTGLRPEPGPGAVRAGLRESSRVPANFTFRTRAARKTTATKPISVCMGTSVFSAANTGWGNS